MKEEQNISIETILSKLWSKFASRHPAVADFLDAVMWAIAGATLGLIVRALCA